MCSAELSICEVLATLTSCNYEPELKQYQYELQYASNFHLSQQTHLSLSTYNETADNDLLSYTSHLINCLCNLAKGYILSFIFIFILVTFI